MVNLIFGIPWWIFLAVTLAGVAGFWVGNNRQLPPLQNGGAAVALLGVLLLVSSFVFETDQQKCLRQSKELAKDVQNQAWPALTSLLDPHVSMNVVGNSLYVNRDDLLKGVQDGVQQYGLKNVTVIHTDAKQTQTIITVAMDVLTTQEATMGRPVTSSWEMEWQQNGSKWLLYRLNCVRIADMNLNEMRGVFPR